MDPAQYSSLEQRVEVTKRTRRADRLNNALESVLGIPTDIFTGLDPLGIAISRTINAAIGYCTGHVYGGFRDRIYQQFEVTKDSSILVRYLADLAVFNAIQSPVYVATTFITSVMLHGINENVWSTTQRGAKTIVALSFATCFLKGMYTDFFRRRLFSVPTAQEKVDKLVG